MTSQTNNSYNQPPQNQPQKKKSPLIRWIAGVFFAIFLLVTGFHYSSIFLLGAVVLMLPLPFIEDILQKKNIKTSVAIILSVVLFFIGVLTSPSPEEIEPASNETLQTTEEETEIYDSTTTYEDETITDINAIESDDTTVEPEEIISDDTTAEPESTSFDDTTITEPEITSIEETTIIEPENTTLIDVVVVEPEETTARVEVTKMVWVSSTGSKYHSKSSCSGMKSASQISLENAKNQGYVACQKCH